MDSTVIIKNSLGTISLSTGTPYYKNDSAGQFTTTSKGPITISAPVITYSHMPTTLGPAVILGTWLDSVPQSSQDTLCFPVEVIRKVLIAAEQKKVLEQQVDILNRRIENYQSIITNLNEKDSATMALFDMQVNTMLEQRTIFENQISALEKLLKKERRKRRWITIGGLFTTGVATYLFITK